MNPDMTAFLQNWILFNWPRS